jgi:hypothetical protein
VSCSNILYGNSFFVYLRQGESSSEKLPISLQIAATMETIIEKNIFQQAGSIQG